MGSLSTKSELEEFYLLINQLKQFDEVRKKVEDTTKSLPPFFLTQKIFNWSNSISSFLDTPGKFHQNGLQHTS